MKRATWLWITVAAIFLLRLLYGLVSEFWEEDELQTYLLGLRFFTTHSWPYFGPDVVYTMTQLPGALQGLLAGAPLFIIPLPETPVIFLNLMTFALLCLFCWWVGKRTPGIPRWLIWCWILTLPWAVQFGSRVVNLSYVPLFSIPFFISFFELMPIYRDRLIPAGLCHFLMGLAVTCVMQLHLSWILLVPFILALLILQIRNGTYRWKHLLIFCTGALTGLLTLLPTLIRFGWEAILSTGENVLFNPENLFNGFTILTRFLALATWDAGYMFAGQTNREIIQADYPWATPFMYAMFGICCIQVGFFILGFFLKHRDRREWQWIRWITFSTFILIYLFFFFSAKGPSAHTYFILFPVAVLYSLYCYRVLERYRSFLKIFFTAAILMGFVLYTALGLFTFQHYSLYRDRERVERAIEHKDYRIVGERRSTVWEKRMAAPGGSSR